VVKQIDLFLHLILQF